MSNGTNVGAGNWGWSSGSPGTIGSLGYYQSETPASPVPAGFNTSNEHAYTRQVQGDELVENRMIGLMDSNNPWMRNARSRGEQFALRRGGINSAIAAGQGERSAIEGAMPIASQDAATVSRVGSENLGYLNQGMFMNRELQNRLATASAGAGASMYAADRSYDAARYGQDEQTRRQREQLAYSGEQAGLDRAHQYGMAGFEWGMRDSMANNDIQRENWMADQNFGREIAGMAATLPALNFLQWSNNLMDLAMQDPDLYDPQVISNMLNGFGNIFGPQMGNMFRNLLMGGGG